VEEDYSTAGGGGEVRKREYVLGFDITHHYVTRFAVNIHEHNRKPLTLPYRSLPNIGLANRILEQRMSKIQESKP
jgi:hypothetical protein